MGETPTYLLPYPELDEPDDVPADMQELADRLELVLPTFETLAHRGAANGYTPLGADSKIPAAYLPSAALGATPLRKVTQKDVTNSTAKTDLLNGEFTVLANSITATGIARLEAHGDLLNATGSSRNITLELKLGAAVLWDSGPCAINPQATFRRGWRFTAEIWAAPAGQVRAGGLFVASDAAAATAGVGPIGDTSGVRIYVGVPLGPAVTVALGSPNVLALNVTFNVNSTAMSMRLEHARVEFAG